MVKKTEHIVVRGAWEHNLKGVDLSIPRDALVTITGVSGSGKSSLAYNTIYQEGQRRFLESLSSYARQFLGRMEKPKVEHVEGLSPTVSIDQKSVGHSPRSTVGTLTEVLDFLRLLYARLGVPACPECGARIEAWSVERIVQAIVAGHEGRALSVLSPVVRERKGEYRKELQDFRARGFVRARIDGAVRRLDEDIELHRYKYHTIELVVDRLRVAPDKASRLAEAVEQAIALSRGLCAVLDEDLEREAEREPEREREAAGGYRLFSTARACPEGHGSLPEMEPRLFSFNSPIGACPACDGLGETHSVDPDLLVVDRDLSIRDRALHGFTPAGKMVYSTLGLTHLEQVAKAFGFDLDTPWRELKASHKKVVLYGSAQKQFDFRWQTAGEKWRTKGRDRKAFPGLVPHLESVYRGSTARHLERFRAAHPCAACDGTRLGPAARAVTFRGENLPSLLRRSVEDAARFFAGLELAGNEHTIGHEIVREIGLRLAFLGEVGLGYVTLDRRANTLSGGESQRIRLAAQVGAGLRGILYVLDEPSIGLHARDQARLLATLRALRDRGNSVLVVEHDEATMAQSDFLVDVGPGAGRHGGEIVAAGSPYEVYQADSLTAAYLRGERGIEVPAERRPADRGMLRVRGARHHNLQDIDVSFPLGCLVLVTGVSGSGKSTLVNHIVKRALMRELMGADDRPGAHRRIDGIDQLDKVIEIDQSPIGRTPRSNPATYTKLWNHVRDLFAQLPEARLREYKKGRFSFNVHGGRCEACEGAGIKLLEMQFLAPVEVTCEECQGRRFNPETLEIRFKDRDVAEILAMTVDEAAEFFRALPKIARGLDTLRDIGLGYLQLGQPSTTLSGGEAQRVKLATELQRPATGRTLYLLDEPTTGLHFEDIRKLLACLQRLCDGGNTMVVIEHNLDVIKCADWVIDLGPEGGPGGGRVVAEGTPEDVARCPGSATGKSLAPLLRPRRKRAAPPRRRAAARKPRPTHIEVRGAQKNNLRSVDVSVPLDRFTVVTGVSGSGKSSLAFDTLFSEGQRRFIESMSTYARRFLGRLDRAPVDRLDGLGPAIAIDQKATHRSPRSTVATSTEIHDYLRLLYARVGRPHCPEHGQELRRHAPSQIAREVLAEFSGQRGFVLAPVEFPEADRGKGADKMRAYLDELREDWRKRGFVRVLCDGREHRLEEPVPLAGDDWPELALVVDRLVFESRSRLVDSAAQAAELTGGRVVVRTEAGLERTFTTHRACSECGFTVPDDPHPRYFSFNHHSGACAACGGLGEVVACDPELLVNHPDRPLFGGAVRHKGAAFTFLMRRGGWHRSVAESVAAARGFDLDLPWCDQPDRVRDILLHGCGDERFEITFQRRGTRVSRKWEMAVRWKGLCRQIEEWFHGQDPAHTAERFQGVMRGGPCRACGGERLAPAQRQFLVGRQSLPAFSRLTVAAALDRVDGLKLRAQEAKVAKEVLKEIRSRLSFLDAVGLGYLTLDRSAATLSGGEAQRIRLATQLGNRLCGVLYVLDEPTVGLHPRDTERLLRTLFELRDLGNTIVAVEHDEAVIRAADHVIDMGPGAGHHGGQVVAAGTPREVGAADSLTGRYLRGELGIALPAERRAGAGHIRLADVRVHNLQGIDVDFPLGVLTAVTGVSGSGKSSLVIDALLPALRAGRAELQGVEAVDCVVVDQSPIGTTPSSNPATYTGVFTPVRELFAQLPQSQVKGFGPGRFSFNVQGGRCDACDGKGHLQVEMHFLADVWIRCDVCGGRRFNAETLGVEYRGKNIADVLAMEAAAAADFFGNHPRIRRPLQLMVDVGLGYLQLGQAANTLSGGEAQRIKLCGQLARRPRGHTVYVLDEPTTGLHMDDVQKLVLVLQRLCGRGDTVIVVEHHLDVIKCADFVIELGPEAGDDGGRVVVVGTPEDVAACAASSTGGFLRPYLDRSARGDRRDGGDRGPAGRGGDRGRGSAAGGRRRAAAKDLGREAS